MRLGDGYADLAWGRLDYAAMFRQTLCVHRVSNRIDTKRAWQMLAGSTGSAGQAPGVLLWFSFELGRLVGWQVPQSRTFLMPKGSVAGFALGKKDNWLVTTTELLQLVVFIQGSSVQTTLFDTPWIARGGSPKNQVIVHATGSKLILAELETNATAEEE